MLSHEPAVGVRDAIERGNAFKVAGADCIFVPDVGSLHRKRIEVLVREIDAPVNIIAGATTPPIGTYKMMESSISYSEVNQWFADDRSNDA